MTASNASKYMLNSKIKPSKYTVFKNKTTEIDI